MMDKSTSTLNSCTSDIEQYWSEQIKLKQQSGLSRAAYCRKHNIICSKFTYWEHKLTRPAAKLVPVKVVPASVIQSPICSLTFTGGNELKIYDPVILPTLLSILA